MMGKMADVWEQAQKTFVTETESACKNEAEIEAVDGLMVHEMC